VESLYQHAVFAVVGDAHELLLTGSKMCNEEEKTDTPEEASIDFD